MSEPVIAARGLTKRYGDVSVVVDAINFDIIKRRGLRTARTERRGQDHHDPDDARPDRNFVGRGQRRLATIRRARRCGQAPGRLSARLGRLL